jgi:hypothetical protein
MKEDVLAALRFVGEFVNTDEKFTDTDLTLAAHNGQGPGLHHQAEIWVREYDGTFQYLKDMCRDLGAHGTLTLGKARGVLNCMRSEILQARNTPLLPRSAEVVGAFLTGLNRYAVTIDGKMRFFSVNQPTEGKWKSYCFVDELFGAPGSFRKFSLRGKAKQEVLSAIGGDPDALARFGKELGACGVCGSPLTDVASREAGIGPVCMAKLGV